MIDKKENIIKRGFRILPLKLFVPKLTSKLMFLEKDKPILQAENAASDLNERESTKTILEEYGTSSIDYFKLWTDKSYFFSPSKKSVIAYKVGRGVAISLGDPIGVHDELKMLTKEFEEFAEKKGWSAAFHQVDPKLLSMYKELGFSEIKIGEEATVAIENFLNKTVCKDEFKRTLKKFRESGFTVQEYLPPHSHDLLDILELVSDEWLLVPGRRERTFTVGFFDRNYINTTPVHVLRSPDNKLLGFMNRIPSYSKGEATIDLMRHRLEVPNGSMDFLFCEVLKNIKEKGYTKFSLGLAPMAGVGDEPGASVQEQALRILTNRMNRLFSFKGLKNYKSKFNPIWEDRHLVYRGGPYGLLKAVMALVKITEI
jgi:phosphatidylglycerol lysyltransferase